MALVRVQWSFQGISMLPRDQYVNTFFFQTATIGTDFNALAAAVSGFYTSTPAGTGRQPVMAHMSPLIDNNNAVMKVFDVNAPLHSPPLETRSVGLPGFGGGAGTILPTEIAACLSYKANFPTSVDPRRRRGRLYIGPLASTALQASPTVDATLLVSFCEDIIGAAKELAAVANTAGYDWSVYSRVNSAAYSIDSIYVDNAVDIQRRRGIKSTSRVIDTISP